MTSRETLTSLAMLKVNVDQGGDYLDYLRPFILQVLVDDRPDPVTDKAVCSGILTRFGLEIPERAVQIVLRRMARNHPLARESGVYRIKGELRNPNIGRRKSEAERHIQAIISGLMDFSKQISRPITNENGAVNALCGFLTEFSIPCLRAYLRGTAIPSVQGRQPPYLVLVSDYVLHLQRDAPERFESLLVVVQGHMLANALLCPDLQNAPKSYKGVAFYLDTPLIVRCLGLEGDAKRAAMEELIKLLHNLGAMVTMFSHSRDELESVVRGAANHVDALDGRGPIVTEARRRGTTKSDLLVLAGQLEEKLRAAGIKVVETPQYTEAHQIDEEVFERALEDEVYYFNPRAKEYDINSVRSIYVLRKDISPPTIEKCRAVLVTSNAGFSRAAYDYGLQYKESKDVSSVITDFSLANVAWLKAPMGAPLLPTTELLAYSYAALQPSKQLLDKYLAEMEKLQRQGVISERDHQLLRSSALAQDELMRLTLGEEDELTEDTVTATLDKVKNEIRKEESEKLKAEQIAHRKTQEELTSERSRRQKVKERMYWRCRRKASICAWTSSLLILGLLILAGLGGGLGLRPNNPILGWGLAVAAATLILLNLLNLLLGTPVKRIHELVREHSFAWFLRHEARTIGISLEDG